MIKVFLENLPKSKYGEEQRINWRQSVGEKVFFIFNDIPLRGSYFDFKTSFCLGI